MLSWIPLIGPILQGLFSTASSIYASFKSTQVEQIKADVATAQVSAQIIHDTNDDISIRILRDALCTPVVLWTMIIGWDSIMVRHRPDLVWIVEKYPDSVSYLPYAVICFLLGNVGINAWRRFK